MTAATATALFDNPDYPRRACKGQTGLFFADMRHEGTRNTAIAVCQQCPVVTACRAWVLGLTNHDDPAGLIVAGMTTGERADARGERPRALLPCPSRACWDRGCTQPACRAAHNRYKQEHRRKANA